MSDAAILATIAPFLRETSERGDLARAVCAACASALSSTDKPPRPSPPPESALARFDYPSVVISKEIRKSDILFYTDGSSSPTRSGWGVCAFTGVWYDVSGWARQGTAQEMEVTAFLHALKWIESLHNKNKPFTSKIITDSKYVVEAATGWVFGWEKNGWIKKDKKPVVYKEHWEEALGLLRRFEVSVHWVKGHSGILGNERADVLAGGGKPPCQR